VFATAAHAGGPPPSIDDIDGTTFLFRASGPEYDLNGQTSKGGTEFEMTLTKTGANTVSMDTVLGGMGFSAYYVDGFLMQSTSSGENPPESGSALWVQVSGSPGKLKMKGGFTTFSAPPGGFQVLRVQKISGSQIQN
jgi:hypothetical protein